MYQLGDYTIREIRLYPKAFMIDAIHSDESSSILYEKDVTVLYEEVAAIEYNFKPRNLTDLCTVVFMLRNHVSYQFGFEYTSPVSARLGEVLSIVQGRDHSIKMER